MEKRIWDFVYYRNKISLASALSEAALRISGAAHDMAIDPNEPDPEIDAALANLE